MWGEHLNHNAPNYCIWEYGIKNLDFRDDHHNEKIRKDFATLADCIVCECEKLITLGHQVAEACTEETLKKVMKYGILSIIYQIISVSYTRLYNMRIFQKLSQLLNNSSYLSGLWSLLMKCMVSNLIITRYSQITDVQF